MDYALNLKRVDEIIPRHLSKDWLGMWRALKNKYRIWGITVKKLFLDFDGCIVNSIKAFCQTYNYLYKYKADFVPADWMKVNQWDFGDQCPLLEGSEAVSETFASKHFFKKLEFMPNAKEVLYQLHKEFQIIIVSIGSHLNLARKSMWLYQNLGFVKDVILLNNEGTKMDKLLVNMKDSFFIDDVASNLNSSNAEIKICYGQIYPWNDEWQGIRCVKWNEVIRLLKGGID
jgi:5'(3')-deoxyribonucleotidase